MFTLISTASLDTPTETGLVHRPKRTPPFLPGQPGRGVSQATGSLPRCWTIYLLRSNADGRSYVGLTARPLMKRLQAHTYQARRDRSVRTGGLMDALRTILDSGHTLAAAFDVRVLGQVATAEQAKALEREWIQRLDCRRPGGLNDMPGGGLGGPASATPIEVRLPSGRVIRYASSQTAIETRNLELRRAGQQEIGPNTVYARLALGWSPAEALDYEVHRDGRGLRDGFQLDGKTFDTLRDASRVTGILTDTLRSRLHRRRQAGSAVDLAHDMRMASDTGRRQHGPSLGLRLPGGSGTVTAECYAAQTGVAKSTIIHRWHAAVRAGQDPARFSPAALLELLTRRTDRRCCLTLQLPDGRTWTGGERELVRRIMADPAVEPSRAERLSESGIRRRLRCLEPGERHSRARVRWAFGFTGREG